MININYMKRIFFIIPVLCLLASCKSKEEKALELIDQQMFQTLYDYESYQPVETKIDSAFTSPYFSDSIIAMVMLYDEFQDQAEDYKDEADDAQSSMEIWSDSYSSYARSRYNDAKREWVDNTILYFQTSKKAILALMMAAEAIKDFEPEFCGWQVYHKYRCKSKGGHALLSESIYIIDKDLKEITHTIDIDDDDYIKAKKRIDEIMEDLSDNNDLQEYNDLIDKLDELIEGYELLR